MNLCRITINIKVSITNTNTRHVQVNCMPNSVIVANVGFVFYFFFFFIKKLFRNGVLLNKHAF